MASGARKLIVTADDFGFTRDVNQGIVEAHRSGLVRATSLLATGAAFEHAVELARRTPSLDVGAHLALVGMPSALDGRRLPATPGALLLSLALGHIDVYAEMAAQLERILRAGIRPSHLNTHKHTHLLPLVLEAIGRLARDYGICWIRRPFDTPGLVRTPAPWGARVGVSLLGLLRKGFDRRLARHGCRSTDYFAGMLMTGRLDASDLIALLMNLPAGTTELMCHPGRCTGELEAAPTRLKASRERELRALTSAEVLCALRRAGVELVSWREL